MVYSNLYVHVNVTRERRAALASQTFYVAKPARRKVTAREPRHMKKCLYILQIIVENKGSRNSRQTMFSEQQISDSFILQVFLVSPCNDGAG